MNYFLDLEFHEDGRTIDLISIGIVCEDGRELYFENSEFDWSRVPKGHWLQTNVRPRLAYDTAPVSGHFAGTWCHKARIVSEVRSFIKDDAVFYGYFAAYDWVAFCQLFGTMADLPKGFPMYCRDLKQMMDERGLSNEWKLEACPDPQGEHNALVDARWNMKLYHAMIKASKT